MDKTQVRCCYGLCMATRAAGKAKNEPTGRKQHPPLSPAVRHAQRRAALIEIAIECVAREGPRAVTVRGVCAAAGLNQRYLYQNFAGRDELLAAAYDTVRREATNALKTALDATRDKGPTAAARAAADTFISLFVDPPERGSILLVDVTSEPVLQERREEWFREMAAYFKSTGPALGFHDHDGHRLRVRLSFAQAGITDTVRSWHAGGLDVDRAELTALAAEALVALAQVPGTAPPVPA